MCFCCFWVFFRFDVFLLFLFFFALKVMNVVLFIGFVKGLVFGLKMFSFENKYSSVCCAILNHGLKGFLCFVVFLWSYSIVVSGNSCFSCFCWVFVVRLCFLVVLSFNMFK